MNIRMVSRIEAKQYGHSLCELLRQGIMDVAMQKQPIFGTLRTRAVWIPPSSHWSPPLKGAVCRIWCHPTVSYTN